jgi:hypothetical protein
VPVLWLCLTAITVKNEETLWIDGSQRDALMRREEAVKFLLQGGGAVLRERRERAEAHDAVIPQRGPRLEVAPVNRRDGVFKGGFEIVHIRHSAPCL